VSGGETLVRTRLACIDDDAQGETLEVLCRDEVDASVIADGHRHGGAVRRGLLSEDAGIDRATASLLNEASHLSGRSPWLRIPSSGRSDTQNSWV
jgi:hypothetical protein